MWTGQINMEAVNGKLANDPKDLPDLTTNNLKAKLTEAEDHTFHLQVWWIGSDRRLRFPPDSSLPDRNVISSSPRPRHSPIPSSISHAINVFRSSSPTVNSYKLRKWKWLLWRWGSLPSLCIHPPLKNINRVMVPSLETHLQGLLFSTFTKESPENSGKDLQHSFRKPSSTNWTFVSTLSNM